MNIKNNRGFSLVEVLVTVGLIGVLVSIAVPSYNKYKEGTSLMAMKADLGNGSKTYTAYDAVNDTFCATFSQVGFDVNDSSPIWKRDAFIGFGAVETADCSITVTDAQYQSGSGAVTTETECTAVTGTWTAAVGTTPASCSKDLSAFKYHGSAVPTACKVGQNSFTMGASSHSVGDNTKVLQIKDGGAISEGIVDNCN